MSLFWFKEIKKLETAMPQGQDAEQVHYVAFTVYVVALSSLLLHFYLDSFKNFGFLVNMLHSYLTFTGCQEAGSVGGDRDSVGATRVGRIGWCWRRSRR